MIGAGHVSMDLRGGEWLRGRKQIRQFICHLTLAGGARERRHREDIRNALSSELGACPVYRRAERNSIILSETLGPLPTLKNLNLEYRKRRRFFCISRNCDGCFLSEFVSGTLLAQKHRNFAGLNIGSHGKRVWSNGFMFPTLDWFALASV
jgi:hypothetical protein